MNFILALLIILFILLVGIIPFFLIYLFSDFIKFLLFRVFKYRRAVVEKNLKAAFPELNKQEIYKLASGFYKNLGDILVESLKSFTMTRSQIKSRHKVLNPELADQFDKTKRSIIALPAHYGNWEWGSMSSSLQLPQPCVIMYKPLANKWVDKYARWSRAKYGGRLTSIYKTAKVMMDNHEQNSIFIMASDQSPSNVKKAIWVDFLGKKTAFLHGPEFYAKKYDLPVIFVDIQRVKRGYYELTLELLTDNPIELPDGEITQKYASRLEESIRNKPENWLWSHKRWKHVFQEAQPQDQPTL